MKKANVLTPMIVFVAIAVVFSVFAYMFFPDILDPIPEMITDGICKANTVIADYMWAHKTLPFCHQYRNHIVVDTSELDCSSFMDFEIEDCPYFDRECLRYEKNERTECIGYIFNNIGPTKDSDKYYQIFENNIDEFVEYQCKYKTSCESGEQDDRFEELYTHQQIGLLLERCRYMFKRYNTNRYTPQCLEFSLDDDGLLPSDEDISAFDYWRVLEYTESSKYPGKPASDTFIGDVYTDLSRGDVTVTVENLRENNCIVIWFDNEIKIDSGSEGCRGEYEHPDVL